MARLFIIHSKGGFYADIDVTPFKLYSCLKGSTKEVIVFVEYLKEDNRNTQYNILFLLTWST